MVSRYIGGAFADPEIEESIEEFTNEEILQEQIDNFLAEEEELIQRIKETDKELNR